MCGDRSNGTTAPGVTCVARILPLNLPNPLASIGNNFSRRLHQDNRPGDMHFNAQFCSRRRRELDVVFKRGSLVAVQLRAIQEGADDLEDRSLYLLQLAIRPGVSDLRRAGGELPRRFEDGDCLLPIGAPRLDCRQQPGLAALRGLGILERSGDRNLLVRLEEIGRLVRGRWLIAYGFDRHLGPSGQVHVDLRSCRRHAHGEAAQRHR